MKNKSLVNVFTYSDQSLQADGSFYVELNKPHVAIFKKATILDEAFSLVCEEILVGE